VATIEIETFALATGGDPATFIVQDERFQAWSYVNRTGLLRRTLARGEAGRWLVLSVWSTPPATPDESSEPWRSWRTAVDQSSYQRSTFESL
jgi:hypothetical protein